MSDNQPDGSKPTSVAAPVGEGFTGVKESLPSVGEGEPIDNEGKNHASEISASSEENGQLTLDALAQDHGEALAGFDPAIHAIGADGQPLKKADGTFAKKRGRKAGQINQRPLSASAMSALPNPGAPVSGNAPSINSGSGNAPVSTGMSTDEAARWSANVVFNTGTFIFGEELGKPKDKDEAASMKTAFKNYYDVKGTPNIPPEIGLILAVGMYALPRLRHETMAEKSSKWLASIKSLFRKKEKAAPAGSLEKVSNNAPSEKDSQKGGAMAWGR